MDDVINTMGCPYLTLYVTQIREGVSVLAFTFLGKIMNALKKIVVLKYKIFSTYVFYDIYYDVIDGC